jgi:hypothetical protein
MCIKTIYHNIYADGDKNITERVDCCTPGYMCANPTVRERFRQLNCTKLELSTGRASPSGLSDRRPLYANDRNVRPMTPPSMSPSPAGRGADDKNIRQSKRYSVNGVEIINHSPRRRERRERPVTYEPKVHVPHAPEPPAPRPVPFQRASTMTFGMETPPERGRRPIIVEDRVPRQTSGAVPVGPVDILEHTSSRLHRRSSHRDSGAGDFLTPHRQLSRSPQGYGSAEDERERQERRRRRRELRAQASVMPASMPTFGNTDIYGSSYESSYGSATTSNRSSIASPVVDPSPAVAAVKKELRWEDQMRKQHNDRIRQRPKLSRSSTANAAVQGEVKSILKNGNDANPEELAELYRSVEKMALEDREREASAQRRSRMEKAAQAQDDAALRERLRNRFSMPPRRFTAGSGAKRRTEIWYPDEGYKYFE